MDRANWQDLAEERVLAAQALLAAKHWSSAYYLAGYAVECGLKSCILVRLSANPRIIFEEKRFSEKCWSHRIEDLLHLAGLDAVLSVDIAAASPLGANWAVVNKWSEQSRYQHRTQNDAEALCNAISDNINGVMKWIRTHW